MHLSTSVLVGLDHLQAQMPCFNVLHSIDVVGGWNGNGLVASSRKSILCMLARVAAGVSNLRNVALIQFAHAGRMDADRMPIGTRFGILSGSVHARHMQTQFATVYIMVHCSMSNHFRVC